MVGDFGISAPSSANWECGDQIDRAAVFGPVAHFAGTKTKRRNGWGWGGRNSNCDMANGNRIPRLSWRIPQNPLFVEFIRPSRR